MGSWQGHHRDTVEIPQGHYRDNMGTRRPTAGGGWQADSEAVIIIVLEITGFSASYNQIFAQEHCRCSLPRCRCHGGSLAEAPRASPAPT